MPALGIDLGSTYSCVGVIQHGKVEIIANAQGNRTTPSQVGFTDTERLVGDPAKNQAAMNPKNTIYNIKRLIGRSFDDPEIRDDISSFSYKVVNKKGEPSVEITRNGKVESFTPVEISAAILTEMKTTAEAYLGQKVTEAVVTVPAYFSNGQRQATKDAGAIAGLNVLRIINEPTAAAMCYELDQGEKKQNILVFDCGGGTHDVSILEIDDGVIEVKSTSGNCHLGGEDFDSRLVKHFTTEFKRKNKIDISNNLRALRRLKTACERAKRTLSTASQASIEIDSLAEGQDFYTSITRARFEELCSDVFRLTMEPVTKALSDAKMDKGSIDEIVLVGGSTRIPKIQAMLTSMFNGKKLNKSVNPDEAVAYGAAIQAAILGSDKDTGLDLSEKLLLDVTPLSMGIETEHGAMANIVDKNTSIPCKRSKTFTTAADNQPAVDIQIYEGNRPQAKNNNLLGRLHLSGIAPGRRGEPQIEVTFEIDANGILSVSAKEKKSDGSGVEKSVTISGGSGRLSKDDIERMTRDEENFKEEDEKFKRRIEALSSLESFAFGMKSRADTSTDKDRVEKECDSVISWIDNHPEEDESVYSQKQKELDEVCSPFFQTQGQAQSPEGETGPGPTIEEVD
jgi:L1 cell adhesion molecule like protein